MTRRAPRRSFWRLVSHLLCNTHCNTRITQLLHHRTEHGRRSIEVTCESTGRGDRSAPRAATFPAGALESACIYTVTLTPLSRPQPPSRVGCSQAPAPGSTADVTIEEAPYWWTLRPPRVPGAPRAQEEGPTRTAGLGRHPAAYGSPLLSLAGGRDDVRAPPGQKEAEGPGAVWTPAQAVPAPTHHMPVAAQRDEDVAALMDQQFAVDAPVALPGEAPYPFTALATICSLHGTRTAAVSRARCPRGPRHAARTCCTVTTRSWGGRWPCRLIQPGPGPRPGSAAPSQGWGDRGPQGGRWGSAPCEGKGEAPAGRGEETPPRAAPPPPLAGPGVGVVAPTRLRSEQPRGPLWVEGPR